MSSRDRAGPVAFVAVHLVALLALPADPSLPALAGVEVVAGLALVGADAVEDRRAGLLTAGFLAFALVVTWVTLGPLDAAMWVAAAGLLVTVGALLYAGHGYDRLVAGSGGEPA